MAMLQKSSILVTATFMLLSGCNSTDAVYLNSAGSLLTSMDIRASELAIAKGLTINLSVVGSYEDGSTKDLSNQVMWNSNNTNTITIADNGAIATGVGEGGAVITATLKHIDTDTLSDWNSAITVIVGPAACKDIVVTPDALQVKQQGTTQLAANCTFSDGNSRDVTGEVTWSVDNDTLATIDNKGLLTGVKQGTVNVTASLGLGTVTTPATVVCGYPGQSTRLVLEGMMPNIAWAGAYNPDGDIKELNLETFHCSDRYQSYTTINFIIGTGWCPYCPAFMRELERISTQLEDAGGLLVYVEVQDEQRRQIGSDEANRIVNKYIQSDVGWRVGDTDSTPRRLVFSNAVNAFPDAIVVRKSDMKVIAHRSVERKTPEFVNMARNPDNY